jgi:HNH endonuclease/NUMOD4 motif
MLEQWRPIKGFVIYDISDMGRIRSWRIKKILKNKDRNIVDAYEQICLYVNGIPRHCLIHRLVAIAFIENPLGLPEVNHIDCNKHNNFVENLEWATKSRNIQHSYDIGVHIPPHQRPVVIVETGEIFPSQSAVARHIGGQQSHVGACLRGELRQHKGHTFCYVD